MNAMRSLYAVALAVLLVGCRQDNEPEIKDFRRVFDVAEPQRFLCADTTAFVAQFGEQNRSVEIRIGERSTRLPLTSTITGGEYSNEEVSVWFNQIGDAVLDAEGLTVGEVACKRQGYAPMIPDPA